MTAAELIAELQKLPPSTPVWAEGDGGMYSPQLSQDRTWDEDDGWLQIALISPVTD